MVCIPYRENVNISEKIYFIVSTIKCDIPQSIKTKRQLSAMYSWNKFSILKILVMVSTFTIIIMQRFPKSNFNFLIQERNPQGIVQMVLIGFSRYPNGSDYKF